MLNGTVRLQVDHILMLVEILGLTPAQFFHLTYLIGSVRRGRAGGG